MSPWWLWGRLEQADWPRGCPLVTLHPHQLSLSCVEAAACPRPSLRLRLLNPSPCTPPLRTPDCVPFSVNSPAGRRSALASPASSPSVHAHSACAKASTLTPALSQPPPPSTRPPSSVSPSGNSERAQCPAEMPCPCVVSLWGGMCACLCHVWLFGDLIFPRVHQKPLG